MDSSNPILDNPLFIAAVVLFLIVLPLALRQKKKTALDMVLDQYEKEESKLAAKESMEEDSQPEKSSSPVGKQKVTEQERTPSLGKQEPPAQRGIPAFPETTGDVSESLEDRGGIPFPDGKIKVVKEGISISHNEPMDPTSVPKKKKNFVSEGVDISHNEERMTAKKTPPAPPNKKKQADDQKHSSWDEDFYASPKKESQEDEPGDNWIEADIPGLIIEPLPDWPSPDKIPTGKKSSKDIPTFQPSPKAKPVSGKGKDVKKTEGPIPSIKLAKEKKQTPEKSPVEPSSLPKPNDGKKVKDEAPGTVEKKVSKQEKTAPTQGKSQKKIRKTSKSESKPVEIEPVVVSHKDIPGSLKENEKAEIPSARIQKEEEPKLEITLEEVSTKGEESKPSPKKSRPKPFFLDLKYLIDEEREPAGGEVSQKLSPEMVDRIVARLSDLQLNLEEQLVSAVQKTLPGKIPSRKNGMDERAQIAPTLVESSVEDLSLKKVVSIEELDSFLFTTRQRKD